LRRISGCLIYWHTAIWRLSLSTITLRPPTRNPLTAPPCPAENSDFQSIFNEAVKEYNKKNNGDITSDPLLVQLGSCTSADDILAVFHRRDEDLRAPLCNLERFLIPIINVLCKVSPIVGDGVGIVGVNFLIRNQFAKVLYNVFRYSNMQKHRQNLFALALESSSRLVHTFSPWIHCRRSMRGTESWLIICCNALPLSLSLGSHVSGFLFITC
jgi:hypothetical protein